MNAKSLPSYVIISGLKNNVGLATIDSASSVTEIDKQLFKFWHIDFVKTVLFSKPILNLDRLCTIFVMCKATVSLD